MRFKILLLLALVCVINLFAQQSPKAIQILDKAREAYEKNGGVSADFVLTIEQKGKQSTSYNGSIKMKGRKFRYTTSEAQIWFDGKSQWMMADGTDEVSVSEPSEAELESVNPSMLFQIYNKGYTCKFVDSKTINGKMVDVVDITPSKGKQDVVKITVHIEQKRSTLDQIYVKNKNGINQKIAITNYKSGVTYADNVFVFNPKQYPKVEIVDLR